MVNGKFSPGNFSGTKWAREVSGGNLLHPDTFSAGIKKVGRVEQSKRLEAPELLALSNRSVRFKSVRSGTKKNSLGKATFSTPMSLYSLYSRAYVVK